MTKKKAESTSGKGLVKENATKPTRFYKDKEYIGVKEHLPRSKLFGDFETKTTEIYRFKGRPYSVVEYHDIFEYTDSKWQELVNIIKAEAQKHGMDVHITEKYAYVIPIWTSKPKNKASIARLVEFGGENDPKVFLVNIGKRDFPLLEAKAPALGGQKLRVEKVKFRMVPQDPKYRPGKYSYSVDSVEKATLFDKDGNVVSTPKGVKLRAVSQQFGLPKGFRTREIEDMLIEICEKAFYSWGKTNQTNLSESYEKTSPTVMQELRENQAVNLLHVLESTSRWGLFVIAENKPWMLMGKYGNPYFFKNKQDAIVEARDMRSSIFKGRGVIKGYKVFPTKFGFGIFKDHSEYRNIKDLSPASDDLVNEHIDFDWRGGKKFPADPLFRQSGKYESGTGTKKSIVKGKKNAAWDKIAENPFLAIEAWPGRDLYVTIGKYLPQDKPPEVDDVVVIQNKYSEKMKHGIFKITELGKDKPAAGLKFIKWTGSDIDYALAEAMKHGDRVWRVTWNETWNLEGLNGKIINHAPESKAKANKSTDKSTKEYIVYIYQYAEMKKPMINAKIYKGKKTLDTLPPTVIDHHIIKADTKQEAILKSKFLVEAGKTKNKVN